jgi:hypothetical protein
MKKQFLLTLAFVAASVVWGFAQQPTIDNYRPWNKEGINTFEPAKTVDEEGSDAVKVRIGGSFAQQFQSLSHSNVDGDNGNGALYPLGSGFNLAAANLNLDIQLGQGIRLALENYMSSRHHSEFWVKGGYIQVDKLPFKGNNDWFDKNMRVKIGHFEVNYGDQHFRRTDNGNALFNPFVGNYIMDAFATEVGGEVYVFSPSGLMGMVGLTAGLINGDIKDYSEDADGIKKSPSIVLKLAYDKNMSDDLRLRLSGSAYINSNTARNTLYGGDRTGSRYFLVMEAASANAKDNAFSGRVNPGFSNKITAIQFNPFVKYKGLEVFGVLEFVSGKNLRASANDIDRTANQFGVDALYRFGADENVYLGAKYDTVSGQLLTGNEDKQSVNRFAVSAGWFVTKNLMLKAEYVNQNYKDYPTGSLFQDGNFKGVVIEAVAGF